MSRFFAFINRVFAAMGSWLQSPILLILRLFFGISFMVAGISKLQDMDKFIGFVSSLHIPYPEYAAWTAALSEAIGGFLLTLGFLARFASIPLIIAMLVAYGTAHLPDIQGFLQDPGVIVKQPPFNFLLTSLIVLAFGPGYFSLDHFFSGEK